MGATIKYKGNTIAELLEDGLKILATKGKYCEDDITVLFEGGGSPIRTDRGDFRLTTSSADPQLEDATIYEPREIKHNLGVIPSIVCIWGDGVTTTNIATAVIFSLGTDHNEDPDLPERSWDCANYESVGVCLGSGAKKLVTADTPDLGITTNKETFVLPGGSTNKYQANKNYHWLAVDLGLT